MGTVLSCLYVLAIIIAEIIAVKTSDTGIEYSPTNAYGKRTPKNIYAKTRAECEEKLAELITQMNAEIAAEKERLKVEQTA